MSEDELEMRRLKQAAYGALRSAQHALQIISRNAGDRLAAEEYERIEIAIGQFKS